MTQHVALICHMGKVIVTASDRMISLSNMELTYEMIDMKLQHITDKAIVLIAGSPYELDILRAAKRVASPDKPLVAIAEDIRQAYHEAHARRLVDQVLIPRLGIDSLKYFHEVHGKLNQETANAIEMAMEYVNLGATFLLAGVDDSAHLYKITNPGKVNNHDMLSFCCAGIGDAHAESVLAWYRYTRYYDMWDAAYIAFEAKKRAEVAGGVGRETDIMMIDQKGTKSLAPETLKVFEEVYEQSTLKRMCPSDRFERLNYEKLDRDKFWSS